MIDGWCSEETRLTDINMRPGGPSDEFDFSLKSLSRTVLCLPNPQLASGAQARAVAIAGDRILCGRREQYVLHLDVASRNRVFGRRSQLLIRGVPTIARDHELA